jgi:hypothetical protein
MNETISDQGGAIYKRHSLLKRSPRHSREWFSRYYEANHGPLAASQAGFRKFSIRYVQNHVETFADGAEPLFDGVTMTTQAPREDYTRGFFNEPDYDNVKPDELYLFDLTKTVSVLGREETAIDGPLTPFKALILSTSEQIDDLVANVRSNLRRLVINRMETATASALGFQGAKFQYDVLAEAWFQDDGVRHDASEATARSAAPAAAAAPLFFPVREVLIFGPEKPWRV